MNNLFKKGLSFVLVVLLMLGALPSLGAAAAEDFPENALITVGGKTVTKDMGLSDVKELFGEPKLETESVFGGSTCTFYGDNYDDYLYIETNENDEIAVFGSVSEGFRTAQYSFGEQNDSDVPGLRMTDSEGKIIGYVEYYSPNTGLSESEYQDIFFSDLNKYSTAMCRHSVLMFNAVSKLYGSDTPVVFDENTYAYNLQLAENNSCLVSYAYATGKDAFVDYIASDELEVYDTGYFNPLIFAKSAVKRSIPEDTNHAAYTILNDNGVLYYVDCYINPEIFDIGPVLYTDKEKELLGKMHDVYVESVNLYNAHVNKDYFTEQPYYSSLPLKMGKINEELLRGCLLFLNAVRIGAGLNELQFDETLCEGAQAKAVYSAYLSSNGISNPDPAYPPKVDGISDEFYDLCQVGTDEIMYYGEIIGSIYKALDDYLQDPIDAKHRYMLLDPYYTNIGLGAASTSYAYDSVQKLGGHAESDIDLVSWPSKGVTPWGAIYDSNFTWTAVFYSGYSFTDDSSVNVKLLNTGKEWNFSSSDENTKTHFFYKRSSSQLSFYDSSIYTYPCDVYLVTLKNVKNEETGAIEDYTYRSVIEDVYTIDGKDDITSLTLSKTDAQMDEGETLKLNAVLDTDSDYVRNAMVYWSSSDETVAKVSPNGIVTALKNGTVDITAKTEIGEFTAVCSITVNGGAAEPPETIMGDVNYDGILTIDDATEIQRYLAKIITFTDEQLELADFNNDGEITINDATAIQLALVKQI